MRSLSKKKEDSKFELETTTDLSKAKSNKKQQHNLDDSSFLNPKRMEID